MKKIALFVLSAALCGGAVFAQDAAAIVQAAKDRIQSDTMSTRSRMVITARNGSTTERVIDQYSKDGANGYARAVVVFQSPAPRTTYLNLNIMPKQNKHHVKYRLKVFFILRRIQIVGD
jgi:ABC-type phosphate/phosphonate transport system substrate-binding protein